MNIAQHIYQVDAFTRTPFAGNPAAVCVLPEPASERWMQDVAREMNLSETAFLVEIEDGYCLRWFTPVVEVDLCGHATLASAHVLWETGEARPEETIRFHTKSGLLSAKRDGDWIELDFPATPVSPCDPPPTLFDALGVPPAFVGKSKFDYLVELPTEGEVRAVVPDLGALAQVDARGVIVTSRSDSPEYDFVSRFFAPAAGVDEDPVTGSTHCALGPYWQSHLDKAELAARQVSARGGALRVRVDGDRVRIAGQAVTVLRATLV